MGFFNALRNVPWKQYQGTQWRLNFIRSGLNFNAATQIFTNFKARSNDWAFLLPEIYKGACDMHKLFSWRVAMPAYA